MHVARYYYQRGAYVAAIARAQTALTDYDGVPASKEALDILINSYDKLGMADLRDDAKRVRESSFGSSAESTQAQDTQKKPWWKLW